MINIKLNKIKFIALIIVQLVITNLALGIDFSDDRNAILEELKNNRLNPASLKIAVMFVESNSDTLKNQLNLVQIKASFVEELAKNLLLADPYITADYQKQNNLQEYNLINDDQLRQKTFLDLGNSHLLLVKIDILTTESIRMNYQLLPLFGQSLFKFNKSHLIDNDSSADSRSTVISFDIKRLFTANQNNSPVWSYFHSSALINSQDESFSLSASAWAFSVSKVKFQLRTVKLDFRFNIFQFAINETFDDSGNRHAGYALAKVAVVREEQISAPLFISLGIKKRYSLNNRSESSAYIGSDKFLKADDLTLFVAADYRWDAVGIINGIYLDNSNFGADIYWSLPYNTVVSAHWWHWLRSPTVTDTGNLSLQNNDFAIVLRHFSADDLQLHFSYQRKAELFAIGFDYNN